MQNVCYCARGAVATGTACTVHEAEMCVSCHPGYDMEGVVCAVAPDEWCEHHCHLSKAHCPVSHCTCDDTNRGTWANQCQQCAKGRFGATEGLATCTDCATGRYQLHRGKSSCDACQVCGEGKFRSGCSDESNGICANCPGGKFKDSKGENHWDTVCGACARGRFSEPGWGTCKACPTGSSSMRLSRPSASLAPRVRTRQANGAKTAKTARPAHAKTAPAGSSWVPSPSGTRHAHVARRASSSRTPARRRATVVRRAISRRAGTHVVQGVRDMPGRQVAQGLWCRVGRYVRRLRCWSLQERRRCALGRAVLACAQGTFAGAGASACGNCPTGKYQENPTAQL